MLVRFFAAFFALLVPASASAETLTEALVLAYQNSPVLSAAQAKLRVTDEGVSQALAGWRPTVTAQGTVEERYGDSFTGGGDFTTPRSISGTVAQPLFRGGRTVSSTRAAESEVAAERARLVASEQDVFLTAASVYLDTARDQAVLDLTQNNEQVLRKQLDAAKIRFDVGEITRTDVSQSESRVAKAEADRILAAGDLTSTRASYQRVVGKAAAETTLDVPTLPVPESLDALLALAEQSAPVVVAAKGALASAKATVDTQWGGLLPEVDLKLSGQRGWAQSTFNSGRNDSASLMAQMTVPLYQSGAEYSRLRAAKQTYEQRRQEVEDARRAAREEAIRAFESLQASRAAIKAQEAQVKAAELALDGVQKENEVGTRTTLDVLDAEQELLDARVALVRSKRDQGVAVFRVLAAAGQLTVQGLGLPVAAYNPDRYADEARGAWFGVGDAIKE